MRVLDRLGEEFDRVAGEDAARRMPRGRRWLLSCALVTVAAGGAVAAAQLVTGDDISPPDSADVPPEQQPVPGSGRLAGLKVSDPDGGPRWDLRVSDGIDNQICSAVGQVSNGKFGIVGADGRFRALPLLGPSACAEKRPGEPSVVGAKAIAAGGGVRDKTVVSGLVGVAATAVDVRVLGRQRPIAATLRNGAFLAVLRGLPESLAPRVTIRYGGRVVRVNIGSRRRGVIADPDGRRPWLIQAEPDVRSGARRGQLCVALFQVSGTGTGFQPHSVPRCGDRRRDPVFMDVRRYVPFETFHSGELGLFGRDMPSRTILTGAVEPGVRRVRVTVPGRDPLTLRPRPRTGAFAAIWTGEVDPERVSVTVTRAGGARVRLRGPSNLRTPAGRPFIPRRSPANRPLPAPRTYKSFIRAPRDVRLVARTADPAGGPDFAVRTFLARIGRRPAPVPSAGERTVRCHQLGRVSADGRFGRLDAAGHLVALPVDVAPSCSPARRRLPFVVLADQIDDPRRATPTIVHTAVWGVARRDGRVIVEVDGRRHEVVTEGRAYVVPLQPGQQLRRLVVDGQPRSGPGFGRIGGMCSSLVARSDARAPDPAGGAPWTVSLIAGGRCAVFAGLVDGITVLIVGEHGEFMRAPVGLRRARPSRRAGVRLQLQPFHETIDPISAERDRLVRALPGRTAVHGHVAEGVELVTVSTGREVRTLRPTPAGHFLLVADGELDPAAVWVRARFAGGREMVVRGRR